MKADYVHKDSKTSANETISYKITMPLINDEELQIIDNHYSELVDEFTQQFVKEKDMIVAQRIMMNLQQENQELKEQLKIKHDGFMASIEEKCELADENQKLKEKIKNIVTYAYGTDMLVSEYEQLCKIAEVE